MKIYIAFLVSLLIPQTLTAATPQNAGIKHLQRIEFCSDWYEYSEGKNNELRHACFNLIEGKEQTDVTAYVQCQYGYGTCCESECYVSYCQTDNPLPGAIQVTNKNQIIVDLRPEDCDWSINAVGTQFSAKSNGMLEERFDYGDYFWHFSDEDKRQCIWFSKSGTQENRSADIEAVIEGVPVTGSAYISTTSTDSLHETCPEEDW